MWLCIWEEHVVSTCLQVRNKYLPLLCHWSTSFTLVALWQFSSRYCCTPHVHLPVLDTWIRERLSSLALTLVIVEPKLAGHAPARRQCLGIDFHLAAGTVLDVLVYRTGAFENYITLAINHCAKMGE